MNQIITPHSDNPLIIDTDRFTYTVEIINGKKFVFAGLYPSQVQENPQVRMLMVTDHGQRTLKFPIENIAYVERVVYEGAVN